MSTQAEALNPFVAAAHAAILATLGESATQSPISLQAQAATNHQVNVIVRANGQWTGVVMVGMSFITADRVASAMLDQSIKSFDQAAANAIAELVTTLSKHAMMLLSAAGIPCELSAPAVIRGSRVALADLYLPAIVVPLTTTFGEIQLAIGLKRTAQSVAA